jgi:hypothetical protein
LRKPFVRRCTASTIHLGCRRLRAGGGLQDAARAVLADAGADLRRGGRPRAGRRGTLRHRLENRRPSRCTPSPDGAVTDAASAYRTVERSPARPSSSAPSDRPPQPDPGAIRRGRTSLGKETAATGVGRPDPRSACTPGAWRSTIPPTAGGSRSSPSSRRISSAWCPRSERARSRAARLERRARNDPRRRRAGRVTRRRGRGPR